MKLREADKREDKAAYDKDGLQARLQQFQGVKQTFFDAIVCQQIVHDCFRS